MLKSSELRGLEFTSRDHVNILPGNYAECNSNGTGTLQDIFLFDQKLRDAAPMAQLLHPKLNLHDWSVAKQDGKAEQLTLLASNKLTFEILTSDRGQRVISSLVKQWEADKHSDNGRSLWAIVETFFTSLPFVFVREDDMNSKLVLRYMSALSALKEVIVQGLFCTNVSAAMAVTATLTPTHHEKMPLYWYCHQLERERERLAVLVQVFSNVSEIDTDLVRVLLDSSTYILQRVLEDLGFEAKTNSPTKQQPPQPSKLSTIGAVVSMSVQASNQARQLHKWRKHMRSHDDKQTLEPIPVRHKGIQVNGGDIEIECALGRLDSPPPRTPNTRLRRSVIAADKGMKLVLMQDYQPFGRNNHPHLLTKDMWTVSTYSENLVHHLHAFVDGRLMHEKMNATYHAKDASMEVLDSVHFQQCAIALLGLFQTQPDHHVPDNIKMHATSLVQFIQRRNDSSDFIPPTVEATNTAVTPADLRAYLRKGFPADVVNQILNITNEEVGKEKESKTLLLIEQLEHHMLGKLHPRPGATKNNPATQPSPHHPDPIGFGELSTTASRRHSHTSTVVKTLTDQMKALLIDASDGKVNDDKASALLLAFVNQHKRESELGHDRAKMLNIESLCSVLEKKVELELHAGPLDKSTRAHVATLQKFINKLVPEGLPRGGAKIAPKPESVSELHQLLDQALAKQSGMDAQVTSVLETIQMVLAKTQVKHKGASLDTCLHTMVDALQASGDGCLVAFCSGLEDLVAMLKVLASAGSTGNDGFVANGSGSNDKHMSSANNGSTGIGPGGSPIANFDSVVNDPRINAIPLCIVDLSKQLKSVVDSAALHQRSSLQDNGEPIASTKSGALLPTTLRHPSLKDDSQPVAQRVRKVQGGAQAAGNLPETLWENTKLKKPNVLGISATELSEMFVDNKTVLNIGTVHKLIYQVYCERYECNLTEQDNPNSTAFIDFVYDWYLRNYDRRFGPFCTTSFVKERLTRNACADDPTSIDQDVALEIALEEYVKMKSSVEAMLEDIYKAGDISGDDTMSFDEFATVVRNLAPCVSDREIVKMFKEALLDPTFVTITKQRFVNVVIDQGVLSSRVNKFKVPTSGATNSSTFPSHEADIVKTIESIPHKETSASLLLRVKILNMIIAKRIDSETAWLSHRMILRDVHRFKDLNEGAISEIKQKEENFKEAVTRIMKFKFGLFTQTHAPPEPAADGLGVGDRLSSGVVDYVQHMDETKSSAKDDDDISRLEESLRSEMLNMTDGSSSDSVLESQLDQYDNAVKKVRRMTMHKATNAVKKLATVMKMAKLMGGSPSPPIPTQNISRHTNDADVRSMDKPKAAPKDDHGKGGKGQDATKAKHHVSKDDLHHTLHAHFQTSKGKENDKLKANIRKHVVSFLQVKKVKKVHNSNKRLFNSFGSSKSKLLCITTHEAMDPDSAAPHTVVQLHHVNFLSNFTIESRKTWSLESLESIENCLDDAQLFPKGAFRTQFDDKEHEPAQWISIEYDDAVSLFGTIQWGDCTAESVQLQWQQRLKLLEDDNIDFLLTLQAKDKATTIDVITSAVDVVLQQVHRAEKWTEEAEATLATTAANMSQFETLNNHMEIHFKNSVALQQTLDAMIQDVDIPRDTMGLLLKPVTIFPHDNNIPEGPSLPKLLDAIQHLERAIKSVDSYPAKNVQDIFQSIVSLSPKSAVILRDVYAKYVVPVYSAHIQAVFRTLKDKVPKPKPHGLKASQWNINLSFSHAPSESTISVSASTLLQQALEHIVPLCIAEQQFIHAMFFASTKKATTKPEPLELTLLMEKLFEKLSKRLVEFGDAGVSANVFEAVSMIVSCQQQLKALDTPTEYVVNTLLNFQLHLKRSLSKYMEDQNLVTRLDEAAAGISNDESDSPLPAIYDRIIVGLFAWLDKAAATKPKYSHLVRLENYHFIHGKLQGLSEHSVPLKRYTDDSFAAYSTNLDAYVMWLWECEVGKFTATILKTYERHAMLAKKCYDLELDLTVDRLRTSLEKLH
ncbi:hypothetical protein DYB34_003123 [Aphanomyces astaci]|uniref:EF-hand domain-containing protein n=1 Tax=Aphanomyces astaci TaxID=112090 RepID=A0A418CE82_APHAT|nr:hypothetical protein DYB34_003123 [Aphanomyces astaci]